MIKHIFVLGEFENGFNETKIAEKIAKVLERPFEKYIVKNGLLWRDLDKLSQINHCFTDFTYARPFYFKEKMNSLGEVVSFRALG